MTLIYSLWMRFPDGSLIDAVRPSVWGWGCRDVMCKSRRGCFGNLAQALPLLARRQTLNTLLFPLLRGVNAHPSLPSSPGPGGTHCLGASVEHAVCENLPCPKGLPSFRDQQCQTHDRLSSKKKGLLTAVVVDGKGIWRVLSPHSFPET